MPVPRIAIVGSFNTDLTVYTERLPRPGETVSGDRFVPGPGGKGSNQAVAAARLGAQVSFVGRIGVDVFSPLALDLWRQEGIDTRFVVQDPDRPTGVAPVLVDAGGENSIVVVLGANLAVTVEDVRAAVEVIAAADVVLTQLEIAEEATRTALELARRNGARAILNPAPARPLDASLLALAHYLTPNETELETLVGAMGTAEASRSSTESAARSLLGDDEQTIVVTLGSAGARWVGRHDSRHVPGFDVDATDTTGAGDAFNGGLAVALAEGQSLDDAVRFANATAALCVTRPGTSPSMPRRDEVEALLARS